MTDGDVDRCKRQKIEMPREEVAECNMSEQLNQPSRAACLLSREKIQAKDRDYVHYYAVSVGGEEGIDQFVYQVCT